VAERRAEGAQPAPAAMPAPQQAASAPAPRAPNPAAASPSSRRSG
jgi:hypothetical protein